ncbi:MAG: alpha/beta fold hydrolase [Gammaproteobacteria bacterium]|nr:alpha/beta fold hydrolase [Gammaproteobacteria bacterium]
MGTQISRHFATVEGRWGRRQVHYRRSGSGPAVLLLHQSPQSSREYEPLMRDWSEHFTLIAPDTPGYGLSDPLDAEQISLEELATAIVEFTDALGLERFGIYGFHTGGGMAVAVGDAHPDRVTSIAVNGLVSLTPAELENIRANYLPRFVPEWDGSHLAWLWARLREQTVFFPWHDRRLATRMNYPMPSPEGLQNYVREFLDAGDNYRHAYRAAFDYDAGPALTRLQVPALITAAERDPLAAHLDRIGERSKYVEVTVSADGDAALQRALQHLENDPGDTAGEAPQTAPIAGRIWHDSCQLATGSFRLRRHGPNCDWLVLHDAGGSAETSDPLTGSLYGAVAVDLPGHGESLQLAAVSPPDIAGCAAHCVQIAAALTSRRLRLLGEGTGAWIALEAIRQAPEQFSGVIMKDPPLIDAALTESILAEGLPSLAPDWHGGHLTRAWHMQRDGRLFYPWFKRVPASIRWTEPDLDNDRLMLEVRERLKSDGHWQALARSQLSYPAADALATLEHPAVACAGAGSPVHAAAQALAEKHQNLRFAGLPEATSQWPDFFKTAAGNG